MNKGMLSRAIADIDEQFIVEARAECVKPVKRPQSKYIISAAACACACAVTLGVCLPIALSSPADSGVPPQIGTVTPGDTTPQKPEIDPPPEGETLPGDNNPPNSSTDSPPVGNTTYLESGYVVGVGEPMSPILLAYRIDREFDEDAENISVVLSFGTYHYANVAEWGLTKVVISVWDGEIKQDYVLKELTAEEFSDPKYDVEIKHTFEENEDGELVETSEIRTFKNEETFSIPSFLCNKNVGILVFGITVFNGDEDLGGGGDQVHYRKCDGKIEFITYQEYRDIINKNS